MEQVSSPSSIGDDSATASQDQNITPSTTILTTKCDEYDEVSQIMPGLYLSSISPLYEPNTMRNHSISAVLSMLSDVPDFEHLDQVAYHHIEVNDHEDEDLLTRFSHTNQLIGEWREDGRNVLVHCHLGVSRSATIVIAFVMAHLRMGFREALDLVRSKRSVISPNNGFRQQLAYFEHLNLKLCPSDVSYRRYLFVRVVFNVSNVLKNITKQSFRLDDNSMEYIQKLTSADPNGHQSVYKCRDCRRVLFTDRELLHKEGPNLFVHILPWMEQKSEYFLPFGKINCPACGHKLGRYKWVPPYLSTVHFKFGSSESSIENNAHELKVPMVFAVTLSSVDVSKVNQKPRQ